MELKKEDYGQNLIYNKRIVLNRCIYNLVFFFTLFIITLISFNRIKIFIKMYQSFTSLFKFFGLEFYFICLLILLTYLFGIIIYIIIKEIKREEWYYNVLFISDKLDIISFICKCFSIILFVMIFFFNPCTVSGKSMYSTFDDGDRLICSNFLYQPKRGDVITFDATNYANKKFYIKRVVAIEGDVILYVDGVFYVNGKPEKRQGVSLSGFNNFISKLEFNEKKNGYVIPHNKIIVLGDNRGDSTDSRIFGLVDEKDIFGKVIIRLYPVNKIKIFN